MSKNWAICIGINRYYSLPTLNYAMQDAIAIKDFFEQDLKCEQVFYFSDESAAIDTPKGPLRSEPTFANLKRFFRERFETPFLGDGDNLWFFFAGHGELHEGHDYLMPIDVDPGNVAETALKISDISAYLSKAGADNTVMLLDACRRQGRRGTVGIGTEAQPGMVTMYACSPRQSSYEIEEIGQGAFTHTLLQGFRLRGADSCATVQRIDQYLRHQVPLLNQRYGKPVQTPYTEVKPLVKNCLILLPERARLEDVASLKNAAYQAEIENKWEFALQLWTRVLAASRVDQNAIEAFQRIALKKAAGSTVGESVAFETAGSREVAASTNEGLASPRVEKKPEAVKPLPVKEPELDHRVEFEVVKVDANGKITQRLRQSAPHWQEELGQGVVLDMVQIPGGNFQMGSPEGEGRDNERPQHRVTVSSFLMGQYPVTQAQWKAVSAMPKVAIALNSDPSKFKGANRPVERVSWYDAVEFCRRLSQYSGRDYRLPSEAEWEYACRAGTTTPFHFGEKLTSELANYGSPKTTEVGSFPSNGFGLYDVHGNVWEWCQDDWHDSYQGAPSNGSAWIKGGDSSRRMLRGGSWSNSPRNCRSAFRITPLPVDRSFNIGFRVSCAAPRTLT